MNRSRHISLPTLLFFSCNNFIIRFRLTVNKVVALWISIPNRPTDWPNHTVQIFNSLFLQHPSFKGQDWKFSFSGTGVRRRKELATKNEREVEQFLVPLLPLTPRKGLFQWSQKNVHSIIYVILVCAYL